MQAGQGVKLLNILRKYCEGERIICSTSIKSLVTIFCFISLLITKLEVQVCITMMPNVFVAINICSPIQYLNNLKFLHSSGCNTGSGLSFYYCSYCATL